MPLTNQYESEYTVVKSKEKKRRCKNAGIINSCSGKMVHDQMDVRRNIMSVNVPEFEFKIKEGSEIHVIQNDASGMMIIASDQKRFAISQDAAARIQV